MVAEKRCFGTQLAPLQRCWRPKTSFSSQVATNKKCSCRALLQWLRFCWNYNIVQQSLHKLYNRIPDTVSGFIQARGSYYVTPSPGYLSPPPKVTMYIGVNLKCLMRQIPSCYVGMNWRGCDCYLGQDHRLDNVWWKRGAINFEDGLI